MQKIYQLVNWLKSVRHFDRDKNAIIKTPGPVRIERPELIVIRGSVYLGPNFTVMNRSRLHISNNVIIGPNVCLIDYSHNWKSDRKLPYSEENLTKPIHIEEHVWIGYGAIILPGVRLGAGAIVSSGAVVRKDVESCTIVAGNPAVPVSKRDAIVFERLRNKLDANYTWLKHHGK